MSLPTDSPSSPADAFVDALASNHEALSGIAGRLEEASATRPSACTEWDISQVFSHLGSGAEIMGTAVKAALSGEEGAEPDNQAVWDRWDATSPTERVAAFAPADSEFVELLQGLDGRTRSSLLVKLAFLPGPISLATLCGYRLAEVVYHRWDIEVASDPSATLDAAGAPLLLDVVPDVLPYMAKAEHWGHGPAKIAVELSSPERSYGLVIGDSVELTDSPEGGSGVLRAPVEAWLRLLWGRLGPENTPDSLVVESDEFSLEDLRSVFVGM